MMERPCDKIKLSKRDALATIKRFKKVGKQYRKESRIYYCNFCSCWHFTSQEYKKTLGDVKLTEPEKWIKLLKKDDEHETN